MAKFKKTSSRTGRRTTGGAQAEQLSKTISESAQQIWLAGVGAFSRAQAEGTRLFEGLVKEGLNLEKTARSIAGDRADVVRDAVESGVEQARARATDTWDRLEKVFEDRVHRALVTLGVPGRDDLRELSRRVDALTTELRRQNRAPARKATTAAKPAARKAGKAAKTTKARPAPRKAATTARRKPAAR